MCHLTKCPSLMALHSSIWSCFLCLCPFHFQHLHSVTVLLIIMTERLQLSWMDFNFSFPIISHITFIGKFLILTSHLWYSVIRIPTLFTTCPSFSNSDKFREALKYQTQHQPFFPYMTENKPFPNHFRKNVHNLCHSYYQLKLHF